MSPIPDLAATLAARRAGVGVQTYVVGVTGGVAAGKSTVARQLADAFVALAPTLEADVVGSDGFLLTNQALAEADLTLRKGFPETYDRAALARTLGTRSGRGRAVFPGYSHTLYDIDPDAGSGARPSAGVDRGGAGSRRRAAGRPGLCRRRRVRVGGLVHRPLHGPVGSGAH